MTLSKILNASVTDSTLTGAKVASSTITGTNISTATLPNLGRRNLIINGAMQVAQRSASVTGIGAASGYFTLDRFKYGSGGTTAGRLTMTQTADGPSGFANCLKLDCTTADTSIAAAEQGKIEYRIEGQDVQQLKKGTSDAEKLTVSFYVKGNAAATYECHLLDVDNSRLNRQTFNVTTDWNRISLTFVGDTTGAFDNNNARSLDLMIWLHAGSNFTSGTANTANTWVSSATVANYVDSNSTSFFDSTNRTFFITGLQMEVGTAATSFEHRSVGEELALCQRYYQDPNITASSYIWLHPITTSGTSHFRRGSFLLPTPMRASPTVTLTMATGGSFVNGAPTTEGNDQRNKLGLNGDTSAANYYTSVNSLKLDGEL